MNAPLPKDRRRILYVDHILQKWMLIALVILETTLTALAIWGLYRSLGNIIDENMYRVHFSSADNMLRSFLIDGAIILAGTGVVNLSALILADRIWAFYVHGILRGLDAVMHAAGRLDLKPQAGVKRTHAVLDQALRWQRSEALRLRRIRYSVRHLSDRLPESADERNAAAAHLRIIGDRGNHALGD
ncbi:hypothetical protein [Noviherbaspirillum sp.]|uniref:hypothetical protein n=1 Tax=Noviherbaspirillum sp. TaxID=1926288 RepID=UPI002B49F4E6|nr:hypothetical protein [Noviherbaspirillum sp.]HJV82323.1 hypothetical protein [Noviherbaspirillum sp.]